MVVEIIVVKLLAMTTTNKIIRPHLRYPTGFLETFQEKTKKK